ncbi:hypothetical protein F53441_3447 [Fusarium austroafricanum]|uniref:AAA+ ATPase domain-containing protein n=1 Tax=Fusarium austroafricanum TaxID=2364996 RepID=A0A8H4KMM5_9HYPO|nr:hypothetical protein F53441_3447 [Fusarium austroafricanum]
MSRKRQRLSSDDLQHGPRASCSTKLTRPDYHSTSGAKIDEIDCRRSSSPSLPVARARKKPITTVDWRAELCRVLEQHHNVSNEDLLDELDGAFEELKESRRWRLQAKKADLNVPPRYQVLYRIRCDESGEGDVEDYTIFEESPWVVESGRYNFHLRGGSAISNLDLYLEKNKNIAFLVYVDFVCCNEPPPEVAQRPSDHYHPIEEDALLLQTKESITVVSTHLHSELENLALSVLEDIPHPDFSDLASDISFPYLWWFHRREQIDEAITEREVESRCDLPILQDYIVNRSQKNWTKVDNLTSRGLITLEYLDYIYIPGQVIISNTGDRDIAQTRCYRIDDWVKNDYQDPEELFIHVRSWSFDGTFKQVEEYLSIDLPRNKDEFEIESLSYYPERFARPGLIQALLDRGKMFWRCRNRKYVSTPDIGGDGMQNSLDSRFMIDMETYKYMHPQEANKSAISEEGILDTINPEVMDQDEPLLDDSFFKCLPTNIVGYNMHKKEWINLQVHSLREVQWNNQAFEYLVISKVTKELIKAVVMNQLGSQANADLIHGKGNGLFMLLHGGPGTGKTLTAESVAEIAKRPLYRVTCGDIGTKAEDVEKYLEVVLYLGKTWGCGITPNSPGSRVSANITPVVLLDEADVFLEQRSLFNIERNALVSVFLRVLEYYDGILILTSNRVGIFDEAFRSRIQLSLRYNKLGQTERHQIWENFLQHLDNFQQTVRARSASQSQQIPLIGYGMDIPDLRKHLDELSQANLNGREIRNSLSIARQLALYRQEALQFHHLKDVMDEAKKFDDYLNKVHDGYSADDISRGRRER